MEDRASGRVSGSLISYFVTLSVRCGIMCQAHILALIISIFQPNGETLGAKAAGN